MYTNPTLFRVRDSRTVCLKLVVSNQWDSFLSAAIKGLKAHKPILYVFEVCLMAAHLNLLHWF